MGTSICVAAAISTGITSLRGRLAALSDLAPKKCQNNSTTTTRPRKLTTCTMCARILPWRLAGTFGFAKTVLSFSWGSGPPGDSFETFSLIEYSLLELPQLFKAGVSGLVHWG